MTELPTVVVSTLPTSIDISGKRLRSWKMARAFTSADCVVFGGNAYSCILAHEADSSNMPGSGASWATYWTLALLGNTRYIVGDGTATAREYITNNATPPVARAVVSGLEAIRIEVGDETTALTTGTNKKRVRIPYAFYATEVRGGLNAAQASGTVVTVDINKNGTTILSTKLTFDNTETTTVSAATPAVISVPAFASDDIVNVDIDAVDGSTAAAGLKVTLLGYRTA